MEFTKDSISKLLSGEYKFADFNLKNIRIPEQETEIGKSDECDEYYKLDMSDDDIYFMELKFNGWASSELYGFYFKVDNINIYKYIYDEIMNYEDPDDSIDFNEKKFNRYYRPNVDDIESCFNNDIGCITYCSDGNYFRSYYVLFKMIK